MKTPIMLMLLVIIALSGFLMHAEEPKPATTIEQLQAENAQLKDQIAKLQALYSYDSRVCSAALQASREFFTGPQQKPAPAPPQKVK